jgi:hypothetical protein
MSLSLWFSVCRENCDIGKSQNGLKITKFRVSSMVGIVMLVFYESFN